MNAIEKILDALDESFGLPRPACLKAGLWTVMKSHCRSQLIRHTDGETMRVPKSQTWLVGEPYAETWLQTHPDFAVEVKAANLSGFWTQIADQVVSRRYPDGKSVVYGF